MINVAVIGTGYVGATIGACLAEKGHDVTCVDIDPEKVDLINDGRAPIEEPGLDELIERNVSDGSLRATTDLGKAVTNANIILLALPTPSSADGSANLAYVFEAAHDLADIIKPETVVATRSTVPVGTTHQVGRIISERTLNRFYAVSNPEFLAEGTAVHDTMHPNRIVIGADHGEAADQMRRLYYPFVPGRPDDLIVTDPRSSEMSKITANTLLAGQVAIVNALAEICEKAGADWREVQRSVHLDPRIGRFLNPSPGYGGSCFPKDVRAAAFLAREIGANPELLDEITATNEYMKRRLPEKITSYFGEDLKERTIAVWGLSFKPNTDDVREAPALTLIKSLTRAGARITAFDFMAQSTFAKEYGAKYGDQTNITYPEDMYGALEDVDALAIVTDWDKFKVPDLERMKNLMKTPVVFDARSLWENLEDIRNAGFYYDSIGRQTIH